MNGENSMEQERRLELARKAFKEFYAQCFWLYHMDAKIDEADISWVIRDLRHYGGQKATKPLLKYAAM